MDIKQHRPIRGLLSLLGTMGDKNKANLGQVIDFFVYFNNKIKLLQRKLHDSAFTKIAMKTLNMPGKNM